MTDREKEYLTELWKECPANYTDKLNKMTVKFGNHFTKGQLQHWCHRQPFYKEYIEKNPVKSNRRDYVIVFYDKEEIPVYSCDSIQQAADFVGTSYKHIQKAISGSGIMRNGLEIARVYV